MKRTWSIALVAALAGVVLPGCPGPGTNTRIEQAPPEQEWIELFSQDDLEGWREVMGEATVADGHMVLDGRKDKAIVLSEDVRFQDGTLEVVTQRVPQDGNDGPFTISLRATGSIFNWRAVYVVIRPTSVEFVRGSTGNQTPPPSLNVDVEPVAAPIRWRFELQGKSITASRNGKQIAVYEDPTPEEGRISLTADGMRMEVLEIQFSRPEPVAPAPVAPGA